MKCNFDSVFSSFFAFQRKIKEDQKSMFDMQMFVLFFGGGVLFLGGGFGCGWFRLIEVASHHLTLPLVWFFLGGVFFVFGVLVRFRVRLGPKGHSSPNHSFFWFCFCFFSFFVLVVVFCFFVQGDTNRPVFCSFTGFWSFFLSKPLSSNAYLLDCCSSSSSSYSCY